MNGNGSQCIVLDSRVDDNSAWQKSKLRLIRDESTKIEAQGAGGTRVRG